MMLRGFFDESNRNPKDIHFLIAGWTGRVDEWEKFTRAWDDCLSSSRLSTISSFQKQTD